MNRQDVILIICILIICALIYVVGLNVNSKGPTKANVYYDNKVVLSLDLSIEQTKEYTVKGYNGDVVIETQKNKIRVKKETSPLHLCSKQGWVSSTTESIVCLPNKIVIKLESADNQIDAVVR